MEVFGFFFWGVHLIGLPFLIPPILYPRPCKHLPGLIYPLSGGGGNSSSPASVAFLERGAEWVGQPFPLAFTTTSTPRSLSCRRQLSTHQRSLHRNLQMAMPGKCCQQAWSFQGKCWEGRFFQSSWQPCGMLGASACLPSGRFAGDTQLFSGEV